MERRYCNLCMKKSWQHGEVAAPLPAAANYKMSAVRLKDLSQIKMPSIRRKLYTNADRA